MQETPGAIDVPSIDLSPVTQSIMAFFSHDHPTLFYIAQKIISLYVTFSLPFSVLLFILIVIFSSKMSRLQKQEEELFHSKVDMGYQGEEDQKKGNAEMAKKWDMVLKHVESPSENDWRQAVIEADIILGDMLTGLGYRGEGIGEQLKRATTADFKTLQDAWEAHKVRNELAHSGSEIPFSQFEARRVIQLYRKVFGEFFHI